MLITFPKLDGGLLADLRQAPAGGKCTDLLSTGLKEDGVEAQRNDWSVGGGRKSAVKE